MFICQIVNSDRFLGNAVLYSFIHRSAAVRFFEYTANSAGGERLRQEGETSSETGDIILLNEINVLSKMSLVAMSYKRVYNHCNTGSCARVCVCVRHAHRTEVWVIRVRLKYQVEAGPDWIPSRSGLWEALFYSIAWSIFIFKRVQAERRRREICSFSRLSHIIKVRTLCLAVQVSVTPIHGHLECRKAKVQSLKYCSGAEIRSILWF